MSQEPKRSYLEDEIAKQVDQLDQRLDRNNWLFLVVLLVFVFVTIYFVTNIFGSQELTLDQASQQAELLERIEALESRVEVLEGGQE
ncbi:hypothetical protein CL176_01665 [Suicoccus acidiformans]|uniref:Uncharacterized protein n=1 Tax=Suicoccus acidiformans TaxID=2036206 RepID=A0A347WIB9_9LACT|nr:hypothetical protein [Suicoccus acidiformans]AXY24826.1 hypothetical protein CL176_01665 [Suicoccus acidiformans]